MAIGKHIWNTVQELLNEHDCVIVPGFGGFVGNREPARIDQVSHLITPPAKRIVFNQNLKNNDGLLANRLTEKLKLNYNEALAQIEALVDQTRNILQDKKHVDIELFGSFRLNADANYVFLPDKQHNYLPGSFGLAPLLAEPVASRTANSRKTRMFRDRKELKKPRTKSKSKWGPGAVVTVLTLLLGINMWIFLQDHQIGELNLGRSEMNLSAWFDSVFNRNEQAVAIDKPAPIPTPPVISDPVPADTASAAEEPQVAIYDLEAFAANIAAARPNWSFPVPPAPEPAVEETTLTPVEEVPVVTDDENTGNEPAGKKLPANKIAGRSAAIDSVYFVIGGVFCKERNAKRFCDQLKIKGYTPELLINNSINCKRVSYAKFKVRKEAELFLSDIKTSENPGAWILSLKK